MFEDLTLDQTYESTQQASTKLSDETQTLVKQLTMRTLSSTYSFTIEKQLEIALALLHLPVLEKKLLGATIIIQKCNTNQDFLVEWCDRNDIFQLFFSKFLHAELIKKVCPLLEFLHRQQRLTLVDLNQMWNVATKKHEAFRHAIFKVLIHLAQNCLNQAELSDLFAKVKGMQNKDHDRLSLNLVKTICKALNQMQIKEQLFSKIEFTSGKERRPRSFSEKAQTEDDDENCLQSKRQRSLSPKNNNNNPSEDQPLTQLIDNHFSQTFEQTLQGEKKSKNNTEEELSHRTGNEINLNNNNYGTLGIRAFGFEFDEEQPNISIEEHKHSCSNHDQDHFSSLKPQCFQEQNNEVANQILNYMWQLCLDNSTASQISTSAQVSSMLPKTTTLPQSLHLLALEQLSEVVCYQYPNTWFYFVKKAIDSLKTNKYTLTMQLLIRKLIAQVQLPIQASKQLQIRDRATLLKFLDQKMGIVHSCTSSLVLFKRESLILMQNVLAAGHQEDDNLETQSSLDDSSTHSQENLRQQNEQQLIMVVEEEVKEDRRRVGTRSFLDTMITNKTYQKSYYQETCDRLEFLKSLIHLSPENLLKESTQQILWEILVQNAFYEKERDLFFNWASEILKSVQQRQNQLLLENGYQDSDVFNDDCLEQLFFETLLKLEFKSFTSKMLTCFWDFLLHINHSYGQVELLSMGDFKAHTFKLIGIEALFEIYFSASCDQVQLQAEKLLIKLLSKCELNKDLKLFVLHTCEQQIKQGLADPQKYKIARCVQFLHKFINQIEMHKQQNRVESVEIRAQITNQVSGTQGPAKFELVFTSMTQVQEIFQQCALKIFPQRSPNELELLFKGRYLEQPQKTLGEITNETQLKMILGSKSEIELEYQQMQAIQQTQTDDEQVKEAVANLKEFLGGCELEDKVIGLALKKCNFDLQEAMLMITDPDQIASLETQLEQEELQLPKLIMPEVEQEQEISLSNQLSNSSQYFELLFDLLNLVQPEVTESVWTLLNQLPVNKALLNKIQTLDGVYKISDTEYHGWESIVEPSQSYRMLYSLKLINSMVSVTGDETIDTEAQVSWRLKFLELGGFNHLYQLLLSSVHQHQSSETPLLSSLSKKSKKSRRKQNQKPQQQQDQARCLSLLISLIQAFLSAALLSIESNRHLQQLIQTSSTSPFVKNKKKQLSLNDLPLQIDQSSDNQSSNDKSSQNTPTFNRSFNNQDEAKPLLTQPAAAQGVGDKKREIQAVQIADFPKLIQQIKDYADQILFVQVDFNEFIKKILQITCYTLQESDVRKESQELVQRCLDTILPILIWQPKLIEQADNLDIILMKGLLSSSQQVRECIARFFRICSQSQVPGVCQLILTQLYSTLDSAQPHQIEYFQLLAIANYNQAQLFEVSKDNLNKFSENGVYFVNNILEFLVDQVKSQKLDDIQVQGNLTVIQSLVEIQPAQKQVLGLDFANFLFNRMFNVTDNKPRFQSKAVRKKCMDLLKSLSLNCPDIFKALLEKLDNFQIQIEQILQKKNLSEYFQNQGQVKSQVGYVGLKNFGSTCYMNSLLQQLFMVKEFSQQLLSFSEEIEDPVVLELRKIFANLIASEKQAYSPTGFTEVFQLERGVQLNVRQQQDAQEFLNVLLDNLENSQPLLRDLIKSSLGGTIINELKSLEPDYPYQSHREEPFYCLSLDIKGKQSLQEALDFWIKPDILEGENKYQCDKYNQLIEAQRRQFLKSTQDTLIINLKRFEFDYNQMMHVKINDFCQFPHEIDLYGWTQYGINADEDSEHGFKSDISGSDHHSHSQEFDANSSFDHFDSQVLDGFGKKKGKERDFRYQLVGVLVHSGSANSGHYYSYIKEREGLQRWLEFNDTHVREFQIEELAGKCFGKQKEEKQSQFQFESQANAYLLFYERIQKSTKPQPNEQIQQSDLFKQIYEENNDFTKMSCFLDWDYFQFLWDFVSQAKPMLKNSEEFLTCHRFSTKFVFDMLCYLKETGVFVHWMPLLEQIYAENAKAAVQLCEYFNETDLVQEVLLEHTNGEVRESFAQLLKVVIKQASIVSEKAQVLMEKLCNLQGVQTTATPGKNDEFFDVLKEYLNNQGPKAIRIFYDCGFIEKLIKFIAECCAQKFDPYQFTQPLDLLTLIINGSTIKSDNQSPKQLYQNFQTQFLLPKAIIESLTDSKFFSNILTRLQNDCNQINVSLDNLSDMIIHLAWEDDDLSNQLVQEVLTVSNQTDCLNHQQIKHFGRKIQSALLPLSGSDSSGEEEKPKNTAFDELFM